MTDAAVMTREEPLTEAAYVERRTSLERQLRKASEDHDRAAYRVELQQIDPSELSVTRDAVLALQDRQSGLERAWEAATRERRAEDAAAAKEARKEAGEAIELQLTERETVALAIEALMPDLGALLVRYAKADQIINATVALFPALDRRDVIDALHPFDNHEQLLILGKLYEAGLRNLPVIEARRAYFVVQERSLADFVRMTNESARAKIAVLTDDGDE